MTPFSFISDNKGQLTMAGVLGMVVVILVALSLAPTVFNQSGNITTDTRTSITNNSITLLNGSAVALSNGPVVAGQVFTLRNGSGLLAASNYVVNNTPNPGTVTLVNNSHNASAYNASYVYLAIAAVTTDSGTVAIVNLIPLFFVIGVLLFVLAAARIDRL